jgi:hypothetical protein
MNKLLTATALATVLFIAVSGQANAGSKNSPSEQALAAAVIAVHHEKCDTPQSEIVRMGYKIVVASRTYNATHVNEALNKIERQVTQVGGIDNWCDTVGDKVIDAFETGFLRGLAKGK